MKLGKKTKPADAVVAAAPTPAAKGTKQASPYQYLAGAILALIVGLGLALVLIQQWVLEPADREQRQAALQLRAEAAGALVASSIRRFDQEMQNLSTLALVGDAMADPLARRQMEVYLAGLFPHAERVLLTPLEQAVADTTAPVPLSFAGLDLIRRAEAGEAQPLEAFFSGDRWLLQKAQAIRDAQSNAVLGTVWVVLNQKFLTETLTAVPGAGQVAVVQTVAGESKAIASRGATPGEGAVSATLPIANWSLRYGEPSAPSSLIAAEGVWTALAVALLIALAGTVGAFIAFVKALRKDVMLLTSHLQSSLLGERPKEPALRNALLQPLLTVVAQHLKNFTKRAEKVPDAKPEAAAVAAAPASPAPPQDDFAAPLFQNNDVLDINMMDGDDDLLGLGGSDTAAPVETVETVKPAAVGQGVAIPAEIFRAYDIRGLVGRTLTEDGVYLIGRALGSEARERGIETLCVGYDGRASSPALAQAVARGIMATGVDVIAIGMVPTPVLYFSTYHLNTGSGVMITGSHNPSEYNGLKMMLGGETLASEQIQSLYRRIREGRFQTGEGQLSETDVRRDYLETILNDIAVAAPLKVVVDAGNGVAGELGPQLLAELGCEVIPLYCEVDGNFPNHHPDPGKPENLQDLIAKIREEGADLGVAFDGDGDRIGVVTNEGKIIWPDRLLMLFAKDVVSRNPGADVIFDVKCTRRLNALISGYGGRPIMWKTGHSLIKNKMKETGALLAGEMSGHIFFKERWFGFDDGLYSAARLLEILGVDERSCHSVFAAFPEDVSTPEINVEVTEASKFKLVERLAQTGDFGDGNMSTIDGVRVDYPSGWGLCRASNTTPVLVLRFEADSQESLEQIQDRFRQQLLAIDDSLFLPF